MNEDQIIDESIETDIDTYIEGKNDRHMCAFLNGVRCNYRGKNKPVKVSLSWDSVTCPSCLALKKDSEPWTTDIPTQGD